ncbi:acetyl/propionyl/methylcrotonyl-CoA carboxylase subunit alpha [Aliikangiella coralliicola]|uniref:Biotin carboxylase n=1 Tax=Aliikangiella coralliicola TaxID=2592383 RepID=A0A545UDK5_9GAMM|nr:acetyl/propionyl/methylcrotonyl-CoA carboxylase subunit alpha [Aliikangiella coralliicola]TQV87550.1 acetyl/propionyl/methylcrotonyl-CoA carboxylase subunit alpha [Aliikangiella coralliicola]
MAHLSINKLLIANRGEIACRIIRTAQRMGIECVAVYSDADKDSQHVKLADEAWHIGGPAAKDSYLKADTILEVAKKSNANAIHPGYGFLSENAEFARQCEANQVIFVGPPVPAIEAMGSKSDAKSIMENAGVPLVQGYHGNDQSDDRLQSEADKIGYPLLIKATAGGGGKGMRVVESSADFIDALNSCKREAISSFGDDRVLVEKYLTKPRHVEIQVFADSQGDAVHLFERDCSIQRRHQKVIEEAPAPGLSEETREQMGQVAITAAKAIGYEGAGTVEFLYDHDGSFYFMEMNTRLQVEHPVTEMITGLDLVEWQIMVANGLPLPLQQNQLTINGHAFEARIYAEDPDNDFLPATGKISYMGLPQTNANVRVDSGIVSGDSVSVYYDPMIAKLIVWDRDRSAALARLRGALADFHVAGLTTNIEFLHHLASNDSFNNADLDTHFLDKHGEELTTADSSVADEILAAAALHVMLKQADKQSGDRVDPYSPWNETSGWRLNEDNHHLIELLHDNNQYTVTAHFRNEGLLRNKGFLLEIGGKELVASGYLDGNRLHIDLDGHQSTVNLAESDNQLVIFKNAKSWELEVKDNSLVNLDQDTQANLTAPMPGTVIDVLVNPGDTVEEGQALIVMEAMKMEHTIKAHKDSVIAEVLYQEGDLVDEGAELISFEEE